LHVHGNVPVVEVQDWSLWLCQRLRTYTNEAGYSPSSTVVVCTHVEKVKSFAPHVKHYVADVYIGPLDRLKSVSCLEEGCTGIIDINGHFISCHDRAVKSPSCALSPDGILHQSWMR
jgi:hypothetical protein